MRLQRRRVRGRGTRLRRRSLVRHRRPSGLPRRGDGRAHRAHAPPPRRAVAGPAEHRARHHPRHCRAHRARHRGGRGPSAGRGQRRPGPRAGGRRCRCAEHGAPVGHQRLPWQRPPARPVAPVLRRPRRLLRPDAGSARGAGRRRARPRRHRLPAQAGGRRRFRHRRPHRGAGLQQPPERHRGRLVAGAAPRPCGAEPIGPRPPRALARDLVPPLAARERGHPRLPAAGHRGMALGVPWHRGVAGARPGADVGRPPLGLRVQGLAHARGAVPAGRGEARRGDDRGLRAWAAVALRRAQAGARRRDHRQAIPAGPRGRTFGPAGGAGGAIDAVVAHGRGRRLAAQPHLAPAGPPGHADGAARRGAGGAGARPRRRRAPGRARGRGRAFARVRLPGAAGRFARRRGDASRRPRPPARGVGLRHHLRRQRDTLAAVAGGRPRAAGARALPREGRHQGLRRPPRRRRPPPPARAGRGRRALRRAGPASAGPAGAAGAAARGRRRHRPRGRVRRPRRRVRRRRGHRHRQPSPGARHAQPAPALSARWT